MNGDGAIEKNESSVPPHTSQTERKHRRGKFLPQFHQHAVTPGIAPEGESGRKGIHPWRFLKICGRSSSKVSAAVNVLWPVVPIAIAIYFARPEWHLTIFILNYIAMPPAANLLGFAGQELARKLPKVMGIIIETTLGSCVEIILFMVLVSRGDNYVQVVRAAIIGSLLANLLLCLGLCFFVGGMKRDEQTFHEAISEVGTGLMLVAAMGLVLPSFYGNALVLAEPNEFQPEVVGISRAISIMFLIAYVVYLFFQAHTHHGLYDDILEQDELKDADRHKDLAKAKLTLTECVIAIAIAIAAVALIAIALVDQIVYIVDRGVSDAFVGLILIPLVEKVAEHLTAVDEAWDNQANFALAHVLGASIQTALLNTPLVILVGWGIGTKMDLNFEIFDAVVLILAVLVLGNFLRDGKSNYLEGTLCVIVYVIIAICAFYYPNPIHGSRLTTTQIASLNATGGYEYLIEVPHGEGGHH